MLRAHRLDDTHVATADGIAATAKQAPWVEAIAPDAAERQALARAFGLHESSLDDALEPQHPPVFREFADHLFVIVHAPEGAERKATRKVALFIGDGWLVTVVRAELPLFEPVRELVRGHAAYYLHEPALLAHAIMNHMADVFEERVDEMIDRCELLEARALEQADSDVLPLLHELRRRSSYFTRVVRAQRDVAQALARGGVPFLSRAVEPYLRDVADHMLRIYDLLESVRDGILAARDSHLTTISNQLNLTMRTLTAVATILLPLGLVASIFGMNFDRMPLLRDPGGFWIVVGAMAAGAGALFLWFRLRKWL